MARKRHPNSKIPFGGLNLGKEEEKTLQKILNRKEISLAKVQRYLIREWIKQQTDPKSGVLKLTEL